MAKELFDLGEDLSARLADFCDALYGARKSRVVREALSEFINNRLEAEPELRKRFESTRSARVGEASSPLTKSSLDEVGMV